MIQAAADALRDGRNQYPPLTGVPELRRAVAAANARFYGIGADPATEVVVTSGATEAITASLMALLNPGDEVVLIEPLYDTYLPVVRMLGAVPRIVRLQPPRWELPRAESSRRVRAADQGDPAEHADEPDLQGVHRGRAGLHRRPAGPSHDAYAVCDEVYEHLTYDGWRHIPLMTLPGLRERCLRIGSAGKTFSLTGWKVGYVTAPAPLALLAARAHQNLTFTTPPNLQRGVAVGLAKGDAYFAGLAGALQAKRDRLAAGLAGMGFGVLPSQGTYFLTVDFSPLGFAGDDVAFCRHITQQAGVTAIPLSAFYDGADAPGHYARFAFCKADAVLDEAVARLRRHFGQREAERRLTAAG